jgi:hypothetical protein
LTKNPSGKNPIRNRRTRKSVVDKKTTATGREVWTIFAKGRRARVTTSAKSVAALNKAVKRYRNALRRLADR